MQTCKEEKATYLDDDTGLEEEEEEEEEEEDDEDDEDDDAQTEPVFLVRTVYLNDDPPAAGVGVFAALKHTQ
jgi:hypothetical protein